MKLRSALLAVTGMLLVGAGVGFGSAAAVPWFGAGESGLRLSWSARPERLETCRPLTEAEIAARPAHMRQGLECAVTYATYELAVALDGEELDRSVVQGGGLRNDRPLHLLRDHPVTPGVRHLRVELRRRETGDVRQEAPSDDDDEDEGSVPGTDRVAREREQQRQRRLAALPPVLVLDTIVALHPGRTLLVTYDGRGKLVLVR